MRKWGAFVLIVVILSVLGSYKLMGTQVETEIKEGLAVLDRSPNLQVMLVDYQRHWFTSRAILKTRVYVPAQQTVQNGQTYQIPAQNFSFDQTVHIFHGPIILGGGKFGLGIGYARTETTLPKQVVEKWNVAFPKSSVQPKVLATVFLKYTGTSVVTLTVPPFTLLSKEGSQEGTRKLEWLGAESKWRLASRFNSIKGTLRFHGLKFQEHDKKGTLGPLTITYDAVRDKSGIWAGEAGVDFAKIALEDGQGHNVFTMRGMKIHSTSDVKKDLVGSSAQIHFKQLLFGDLSYGPGTLELSLKGLNAPTLVRIQQELKAANSTQLTAEQRQITLFGILPKLPELFGKDAEFELKQLHLVLPQGAIGATAKVSISKATQGAPSHPMEILSRLQAQAHLELPEALVQKTMLMIARNKIQQEVLMRQLLAQQKQSEASSNVEGSGALPLKLSEKEVDLLAGRAVDSRLRAFMQAGIFVKKEHLLTLDLVYQAGKLMVNGKPFDGNLLESEVSKEGT